MIGATVWDLTKHELQLAEGRLEIPDDRRATPSTRAHWASRPSFRPSTFPSITVDMLKVYLPIL